MSNPTTPFGWQMPTNTDLVTDLPADFEVFGQAVATSMQDLLGGTTGQVLAKASNTDMDFAWAAAGMTNPMTTTGDVIYSSSGSTPARLGIGTANQVLAVNSGATAPEWKTPSSGGLVKINSTSFSAVSSVSLPANTFSATYDHYKILLIVSQNSTGANMNARLRAAGSDDTSSVYQASQVGANYADTGLGNNPTIGSQTSWTTFGFSASANPSYETIEIFNPFASVQTGYVQSSVVGNDQTLTGGGRFTNTTSFDSLTIIRASGTFTGKVTVYGYEK
jgi:hypothetical protein